ncbi:MAG: HAD family hydrolase [archaeon]|nr:MAG: HAD family hydrolase [archaeon]
MIKAIIFDADHTLYKIRNLKEAEEKKFIYLKDRTGLNSDELRAYWKSVIKELLDSGERDYKKRSRKYSTIKTLVHFGVDEKTAETLATDAIKIFWDAVAEDLEFDPKIREIVKTLKGKYRLCVASDEFRKSLTMKLDKVFGDWKDYFEFLVTADDTQELKPSKKFSEIPLKKLGLSPEEAVFVGDSWERELSSARELGLKTVLVKEEKEGNPDFWIKDASDIKGLDL